MVGGGGFVIDLDGPGRLGADFGGEGAGVFAAGSEGPGVYGAEGEVSGSDVNDPGDRGGGETVSYTRMTMPTILGV